MPETNTSPTKRTRRRQPLVTGSDYYSIQDFATKIHTSDSTARGLVKKYNLPTLRVGVQIRLLRAGADEWIKNHSSGKAL
jgi:hypothetical protein